MKTTIFPELKNRADWSNPALAVPIAAIKAHPDRAEITRAVNQALSARAQSGAAPEQPSRAVVTIGKTRYTVTAGPTLSRGLRLRVYLNWTAQDGYDYMLHDLVLAEAFVPADNPGFLQETALILRPPPGPA